MQTILFLDDDTILLGQLKQYFSEKYIVFTASKVKDALTIASQNSIDCFIVDVILNNEFGYNFVKKVKELSPSPIIMLTSLDSEQDELKGFSYGIDDYVKKPFNIKILEARIESKTQKSKNKIYKYGDLVIDANKYIVEYKKKPIFLTHTEFDILLLLAEHQNESMSKSDIYKNIWSMAPLENQHTVQVHIFSLRQKLKDATKMDYIQTVWKKGYYFSPSGKSLEELK